MRFLIQYVYGFHLQNKTQRLDLQFCQMTDQLIRATCKKFSKKENEINLKVKNGSTYLRIISGWPIQHYQITEGSTIFAQIKQNVVQQQFKKQNSKNKYLYNLLGNRSKQQLIDIIQQKEDEKVLEKQQKNQNFSLQDNQEKINQRKYLDQQLQNLLFQSRNGNVNKFIEILDRVPENLNIQQKMFLKDKKKFLINQLGIQSGWGSIHNAVFCNHYDIVYQLMSRYVDINKQTLDFFTPLQLCIKKKNYQILDLMLVQSTLNINQTNKNGSALHFAAKNNDQRMIKILLQAGANQKLKDYKGFQPIDLCTNKNCIQLLRQQRQNLRQQNNEFEIPIKPPIVKGILYKVRKVNILLSQIYAILNICQGTFIIYKKKQDCPLNPDIFIRLNTIQKIRLIPNLQKQIFMKKEYYYFQFFCPKRYILASKHSQIAYNWVTFIFQSIQFSNFVSKKLKQGKQIILKEQQMTKIIINQDKGILQQSIPQKPNIKSKRDQLKQKLYENRKKYSSYINKNKQQNNDYIKIDQSFKQISIQQQNQNKINIQYLQNQPTTQIQQQKIQKQLQKKYQQQQQQQQQQQKQEIYTQKLIQLSKQDVKFNSFQIIKVLGSGAFGKVFLAKHKQSNQTYAMKALKKKTLILKRQLKYAITQANVLKNAQHPFIIQLHYAFQTPNYLYLVLDFCKGGDLSYHLAKEGCFNQATSRFFLCQLILAIQHLHKKNIIYRDLKPQNILLTAKGNIKLADFGLSKQNMRNQDKTSSFCGSPAYLSPQMLTQKGTGKQSDIYGIGTVLYQLLVGQPPYYSDDIPTLYRNIKQGKLKFPKNISENARNLIISLLQRNPKKRLGFRSKEEIKNHVFFKGIDWQKVYNKQYDPPFVPKMTEEDEDQDENEEFIQKKVILVLLEQIH